MSLEYGLTVEETQMELLIMHVNVFLTLLLGESDREKKSASPILITGILLQKIAPEHSCYVINFYKCFSFGYHQSYVHCALLAPRLKCVMVCPKRYY